MHAAIDINCFKLLPTALILQEVLNDQGQAK